MSNTNNNEPDDNVPGNNEPDDGVPGGNEPDDAPPARKERFDLTRELYDWADALVTSLILVILVFTLIVRIIGVEGPSMMPTLENGDKVLLTNLFYEPSNGDVVVFTKKGLRLPDKTPEDHPLVKRIVATEGQIVDFDWETGIVSIDGDPLSETYTLQEAFRPWGVGMSVTPFPTTVPDGCVFVMGDNRNNSMDSRSATIGMIDKRYILGHVIARVYPFSDISLINGK